jgi:hypothetical protein
LVRSFSDDVTDEQRERAACLGNNQIIYQRSVAKAIKAGKTDPGSDYEEFKRRTAQLLAQYTTFLLSSNLKHVLHHTWHDPATGEERTAQWKEATIVYDIIDAVEKGHYGMYVGARENSTLTVNMELSGALLIGRIYGPHHYTRHVDGAYLEKILSHEFQHFVNRKRIDREKELEDRIVEELETVDDDERKRTKSPKLIYTGLCDLLDEGIAVFQEKEYIDTISWDVEKAYDLAQTLELVAKVNNPARAKNLYDKEFNPDSNTGVYYLGNLMCTTIGLALMKREAERKRQDATIQVWSPEWKTIPMRDLGRYLAKNQQVKFAQLDREAFADTYELIDDRNHGEFFRLYFQACDELGFQGKVRFFSEKRYRRIQRLAGLDFEKYQP